MAEGDEGSPKIPILTKLSHIGNNSHMHSNFCEKSRK